MLQSSPFGRRDRKRAELEHKLVATAFRLFEAHGFEQVTMERIADEADVAKATLYKHFPAKEALLAFQFREEIALGTAALDAALGRLSTFDARLRFLLEQSAKWHQGRRAYMPHYLRFRRNLLSYGPPDNQPNEHGSGTRKILETLIAEAQRRGEISDKRPSADLSSMFQHMLVAAVVIWLREPQRALGNEFLFALEIFLDGLGTAEDGVRSGRPRLGQKRVRGRALR